jgi:hypothetical protein
METEAFWYLRFQQVEDGLEKGVEKLEVQNGKHREMRTLDLYAQRVEKSHTSGEDPRWDGSLDGKGVEVASSRHRDTLIEGSGLNRPRRRSVVPKWQPCHSSDTKQRQSGTEQYLKALRGERAAGINCSFAVGKHPDCIARPLVKKLVVDQYFNYEEPQHYPTQAKPIGYTKNHSSHSTTATSLHTRYSVQQAFLDFKRNIEMWMRKGKM